MNKIDLIQAVKNANGLTKTEAAKVVDLLFDKMANTLAGGDRTEIRGLCSFCVRCGN